MSIHEPFEDAVLGRLVFEESNREWKFTFTIAGREIGGNIVPEFPDLPLQEQGLDEIRKCIVWIRENEPSIRQYITEQMFEGWWSGWYDEEIDTITTREEFQEAISLSGMSLLEDHHASLYYDDGGLFGGHCIVQQVRPDGTYPYTPDLWG